MELPLRSPAKCELRSVIRFLNAKNNSPVEIHRQLVEVYGEKCMDIKNVRKWCREFNEGRINVHDEQRSGRPSLPESTVARIDEMVRANRRITLEEIEDGLNEDCSHFSVHKIVSETPATERCPPVVRLRLHFIIIRKVLASKVQLECWKKVEVAWGKIRRRIRWMCENFPFEVFQQRLGHSSCAYGEHALSIKACDYWFRGFKSGDFDTRNKERRGRPIKFEDAELEALLDEDSSQTQEELSETLGVTQQAISNRLKVMGMVQKQGNWVPYELEPGNIERRICTCKLLLNRQNRKGFLHRIVTGDEKWIHYDNPKRRKSRALKIKRPLYAKRHDKVIYQHDNARPHVAKIVKETLEALQWDVLPHPPYSPDIAPSDYHIFR
ncbi:SETMAR [Cordylochernes scorpioides]|uniref:SETMAR n=1 Tax=Cordylochernes scorpioides TaxID=51811 RepID=A0ABY6KNB3_9ARAC|nr:SETMAR [Cordylochernes scorpioides]